jgi:hypothetical protein
VYPVANVEFEYRVVLSSLLGINRAGALVRIEANALLLVMGETGDDGFIDVSCERYGLLKVFAADLAERTRLYSIAGTARQTRKTNVQTATRSKATGEQRT